jgi:hypothetical protein
MWKGKQSTALRLVVQYLLRLVLRLVLAPRLMFLLVLTVVDTVARYCLLGLDELKEAIRMGFGCETAKQEIVKEIKFGGRILIKKILAKLVEEVATLLTTLTTTMTRRRRRRRRRRR